MIRNIFIVWRRYFDVYKKSIVYGFLTTLVMPVLYLTAFGFGLGATMDEITIMGVTLTYRQFVFAGILGQTLLFQSFFEAAYGGFIRMYYQRIFTAISVTPITLKEVLWGELLWDASKATFAGVVLMAIGVVSGDFDWLHCIYLVPITFFVALMFAALGLLSAALSKSIDEISYPQLLFVMPMFLFCGVFYPIENLPKAISSLVTLLPLSAAVDINRLFLFDVGYGWEKVAILVFWLIAFIPTSMHFMLKRLIK